MFKNTIKITLALGAGLLAGYSMCLRTTHQTPEYRRTANEDTVNDYTLHVVKAEGPKLPANDAYTVADIDGAGYMSSIFMSFNSNSDDARRLSRLQVFVDNETTPSINVTFVDLTCSRNVTKGISNDKFGTNGLAFGFGTGFYFNMVAPFEHHLTVRIVNGSKTEDAILGGYVEYATGKGRSVEKLGKLRSMEIKNHEYAPYSNVTLANIRTPNGGTLEGIYLQFDGNDYNYDYLEGNVKFYTNGDAEPALDYDSTEDYFKSAWYFWSGVQTASSQIGVTYKDNSASVGTYRFHDKDPIAFAPNLRIEWQVGERQATPVKHSVSVGGVVWYYEAKASQIKVVSL